MYHGPFLNIFGEVRDPRLNLLAYQDLKYFYGSYVISPRLARPTRPQFWAEAKDFERN